MLHDLEMNALSPSLMGLLLSIAVVVTMPRVLATTRFLPLVDGVGVSRGISITSLLSFIVVVIDYLLSSVFWFSSWF